MKKIFIILLSIFSLSTNLLAHAEATICDGQWENGQPVHVFIDWHKKIVIINDVKVEIEKILGYGILTSSYRNAFGHRSAFTVMNSTYFVTNKNTGMFLYNSSNTMTFVAHVDTDTQTLTASHGLHCSKSFIKPFMKRMISTSLPQPSTEDPQPSEEDLIEMRHTHPTG